MLSNPQIQLVLVLKLHQLKRDDLQNIEMGHLLDYLTCLRWKRKSELTLSEAVNDILSIRAEQIIQFLSAKAVIDGANLAVSDFNDLILGGKQ